MKKGDLVKLGSNYSMDPADSLDPRCQPGIVVGLRDDIIGVYWEAVSDVEWWFKEVLEKINEA